MKEKKFVPLQTTQFILTFIATVIPFVLLSFALVSSRLDARSDTSEKISITLASIEETPTEPLDEEQLHPLMQPREDVLPTTNTKIGYDASILKALKRMNLVLDHFDTWIEEHPGTALKHVRYMPVPMQRNVASTALFIRSSNKKIDEKTAWREAAALVHYSAKYGVPSELTTAVAHAESTFNPDAISPKGAAGVMQVMWRIHNGLLQSHGIKPTPGPNPLADPENAIAAGCLLLSRYIKAYGSVQTAMTRYYGGNSAAYQRKVNNNIARIMNHRAQVQDI